MLVKDDAAGRIVTGKVGVPCRLQEGRRDLVVGYFQVFGNVCGEPASLQPFQKKVLEVIS